ncbi:MULTISPECIES: hypothetical protein [Sorangium]|uniref:Uncharacterized protein n=1 Tax=Sorangium cellulosum TaxID=56 RepID=A0A4P2QVU1_SORCE|nr:MULTISPECIES: hypothetical protein [Sorangium]AUX34298.1 hypothetical protein SOCE836_064690 [Sorangium cellulosum]WCQ93616.1 hypothetical protein NQZ70_06368 [Sorangium sp. Soce836]
MRYLRQLFVCSILSALTIPVGCGAEAPDGAEQVSDVGSISLALVGTSATGATYRLSRAWFDIDGPTNRLVYGDVDTTVLTEVLPVGRYDVYLEPGWVLERWTGGGYQQVQAALTSPNPATVFIYEGAASTVVFQFRADDDVVSVGQGTLDIAIGVDDTTALREDTDVACSNGYDDDGDGYADCSDPDCQWQPFCAPWGENTDVACSNGYDDDGDGYTDCSDSDCQWQPFCAPWGENTDVACSNGYDDDGDGYADCSDPDCQWQPYCVPWREDNDAACSNGYDDDGDGLADCNDPECQGQPACMPWGESTDAACSNGYDDDWDGLTDCGDPDCQWLPFCATPALLIESFDDGDFFGGPPYAGISPPFTGPWVALSDATIPPLELVPSAGPGTGTALGVYSPAIPTEWGAGVMLDFDAWSVNVASFQGIRFKMRSESYPVRFEVSSLLTVPESGYCSVCLDHHGIDLWSGSEWITVEVRWSDLRQQGWGTPAPLDVWNVMDLIWRTPAGQAASLELDDIELF